MANLGGIKKKSQIKALSAAEISTGKMSKMIASSETASKRINATTLYPIKSDKAKQTPDNANIVERQIRYCRPLLFELNRYSFILVTFGESTSRDASYKGCLKCIKIL